MEEIYVNVSSPKSVLPGPGSRSSGGNTSRCLPLCLGLLILALLAGLAVVSVFFYLSAAELVVVRANLSQTLLACANKTLHRGPLPTILAEGTEAPDRRQETCPAGWTVFKDFCYLFAREVRSWEASRQSCRQAGADLVVIHGPEEQDFLTGNITMHTWIGLTDIETEGTWKWIDGCPLTEAYLSPDYLIIPTVVESHLCFGSKPRSETSHSSCFTGTGGQDSRTTGSQTQPSATRTVYI